MKFGEILIKKVSVFFVIWVWPYVINGPFCCILFSTWTKISVCHTWEIHFIPFMVFKHRLCNNMTGICNVCLSKKTTTTNQPSSNKNNKSMERKFEYSISNGFFTITWRITTRWQLRVLFIGGGFLFKNFNSCAREHKNAHEESLSFCHRHLLKLHVQNWTNRQFFIL